MLLFNTSKILCHCFPFCRKRREFGISCQQLKMTELCFHPPWWNHKWPLNFDRAQGTCSSQVLQNSHGNIANCVQDTQGIYEQVHSFLLWWKLEPLFPHIFHQTIYNLCKICEFENTFSTITCYEYSKISSLYFIKDAVFLLRKIWISIAIAQYLVHLKYGWIWAVKQTLLYNETAKI